MTLDHSSPPHEPPVASWTWTCSEGLHMSCFLLLEWLSPHSPMLTLLQVFAQILPSQWDPLWPSYLKWSEVTQSCPTLCDPMDCSLPCSSIRGILQARILEWVAISFSRGSSQLRDQTQVSCIAGRRFTIWATREAPFLCIGNVKTPQAIQKEI